MIIKFQADRFLRTKHRLASKKIDLSPACYKIVQFALGIGMPFTIVIDPSEIDDITCSVLDAMAAHKQQSYFHQNHSKLEEFGNTYLLSDSVVVLNEQKLVILDDQLNRGKTSRVYNIKGFVEKIDDAWLFTPQPSLIIKHASFCRIDNKDADFVRRKVTHEVEMTKKTSHLSIEQPVEITAPLKLRGHTGMWTVMKRVVGQPLTKILEQNLSTETRLRLTQALIKAFKEQISDNDLENGDISPDNVFALLSPEILINYIDFDCSSVIGEPRDTELDGWKDAFVAPERFKEGMPNRATQMKRDVYSLGRVLALLWGYSQEAHEKNMAMFGLVNITLFNNMEIEEELSQALTELLEGLYESDVKARLTPAQAVEKINVICARFIKKIFIPDRKYETFELKKVFEPNGYLKPSEPEKEKVEKAPETLAIRITKKERRAKRMSISLPAVNLLDPTFQDDFIPFTPRTEHYRSTILKEIIEFKEFLAHLQAAIPPPLLFRTIFIYDETLSEQNLKVFYEKYDLKIRMEKLKGSANFNEADEDYQELCLEHQLLDKKYQELDNLSRKMESYKPLLKKLYGMKKSPSWLSNLSASLGTSHASLPFTTQLISQLNSLAEEFRDKRQLTKKSTQHPAQRNSVAIIHDFMQTHELNERAPLYQVISTLLSDLKGALDQALTNKIMKKELK